MRDIDDGHAEPLVQLLQLELHLLPQLLVERAERLVHQHEARLEHQGPRQRDRAAAVRRKAGLAGARRTPPSRPCCSARSTRARIFVLRRMPRTSSGNAMFCSTRHVRKERVALEHHADAALVRGQPPDRLSVQEDLALGRKLEAGEHHQRRRLAGARWAKQRQELALAGPRSSGSSRREWRRHRSSARRRNVTIVVVRIRRRKHGSSPAWIFRRRSPPRQSWPRRPAFFDASFSAAVR